MPRNQQESSDEPLRRTVRLSNFGNRRLQRRRNGLFIPDEEVRRSVPNINDS